MISSRLDEIGWYQFERFIQALLKAALGPAVEAWGGSGDRGRDCYFSGQLCFPGKSLSDGPFVFQAKFVSGANATGAKFFGPLKGAVTAEIQRIAAHQEAGRWETPLHYTLLTNCPLSAAQREELIDHLVAPLQECAIHFLDGKDIASLADNHPEVRKAFPQLLGLGDLEHLIGAAVNKELVERSRSALDAATRLAPVFVPTRAYHRTLQVLSKHFFAVLEGPPEMGKTAIARTIGALKFADGWAIYECGTPADFFKAFSESENQVFLADDAFGRTEYDPTLGRQWEKELDKLLRRADAKHWLIWTSRKHILERALNSLDFQGDVGHFPDPSAVMIDASALSVPEKTQILFRHARSANLGDEARTLIKVTGRQIVRHRHFTPERIRRLVVDVLPDLGAMQGSKSPLPLGDIKNRIEQSIANPTESMRKSFNALKGLHRTVLFALVSASFGSRKELFQTTQKLSDNDTGQAAFDDAIEELVGAFLVVSTLSIVPNTFYDWIHPGVRDLVIDELSESAIDRRRYLQFSSLQVINLALSEEGGTSGLRRRPLLRTDEDWRELCLTCVKVISTSSVWTISQVFESLASIEDAGLGNDAPKYASLIQTACRALTRRWDQKKDICEISLYELIGALSIRATPLPRLPDPSPLWAQSIVRMTDEEEEDEPFAPILCVANRIKLIRLLSEVEPRFLKKVGFASDLDGQLKDLEARLRRHIPSRSDDSLEEAADAVSNVLDELQRSSSNAMLSSLCAATVPRYKRAVEDLAQAIEKVKPTSDEHEDDWKDDEEVFTDLTIDKVLADI